MTQIKTQLSVSCIERDFTLRFLPRIIEMLQRYEVTARPDRVTPLLDQNWITFLVNSSHRWRGGKLDRSDDRTGERTMERKERHGQSRGNESGLLLRRVSKFPMSVWQRMGEVFVGNAREEGLRV